MAEIKNSFLASKMNKDLDDRLIPSNEYKDALNVAVSNSEDSDVGALENILQNTNVFATPLANGLGFGNGKIIGYIADSSNDNIYLFWTNYTDTSANQLDNFEPLSFKERVILDGGTVESAECLGTANGSTIFQYNTSTNSSTKILAQGSFLNFSTTHLIYGINIVEDFLFWTDNRNQPRKINLRRASVNSDHYSSEDDISVAKYAPYKPIDLYKDYGSGVYKTTMKDVSSEKLPDESTPNPDYNPLYAGDPNYLEDKFVRFSYRFKYEDGEYSIMAPFTQIAFIPKQDGSFLAGDEDKAFQSTVVSFMENKVDQISLVINLPDTGNNLETNYKIKEVDILYKESDKIAISVLDSVDITEIKAKALATSVYEYSYQSRKPIKTLPQGQSTRVYDKTPVRALAQEVSGNRVIYGNYINKHTAPSHINYQVAVSQKFSTGSDNNYSYKEYPEHTLKRNRNYQVGFVLSDRYGRQSDVILSNVINNNLSNDVFGASTLYFPYRTGATSPVTFLADVGNSIKIQLNEQIQSNKSFLTDSSISSTGEPGLYNATTNPTGWYSYKIVVKQNQQEYYNVYLPGFLKGDLASSLTTSAETHSVLISDNINKVPRDLQEVGPLQDKYSSDEVLFPLVENVVPSSAGANHNKAFFPGDKKYEVTTIASFSDLNDLGGSSAVASLFESDEDPLVMRIGDNKGGLGGTLQHMLPTLSIAETTPFVSNLDIYYETSTSGLISELNTSVLTGLGNPVAGFNIFDYTHRENQDFNGGGGITGAADSAFVTSDMFPVNNLNASITTTSNASLTVTDNLTQNRSNDFELVAGNATGSYRIKIKNSFYFGSEANNKESYNFTISLRNQDDNASADTNGVFDAVSSIVVQNVNGTIFPGQNVHSGSYIVLAKVDSVNGSTIGLDRPVTIGTTNTALTFLAPVNQFPKQASLSNSDPVVNNIAYNTPTYSTMPILSTYATITAFNGAFAQIDRSKELSFDWNSEQPGFPGGLGTFLIGSYGASRLITLSAHGGGQVVLALNQSGVIKIFSGNFPFLSTFSLKVTITDGGGATVEATVAFNDVIPGAFTNAFSAAFNI